MLYPLSQLLQLGFEIVEIPVLAGMEANIVAGGNIDLDESVLKRLDLVVAGCTS